MEADKERLIVIDGSYGEGGGQIVRTSLALSAISQRPIMIENIRGKRPNPGLRPQHLTGVEALAKITQGQLEGAHVGSRTLRFLPHKICPGDYRFDIGNGRKSAGSVTLLLQTLLPPLCCSKSNSRLILTGGTHVPWSPPFHYFSEILLPALARMGVAVEARLERWGWYPKGGGFVRVEVKPPPELKPLSLLDRGRLIRIRGISAVSHLPAHVAERQRERAIQRIESELGQKAEVEVLRDVPGEGTGSFLFLVMESEGVAAGFSALGKRGKRAEAVADEAVDALVHYAQSDACLDPHLADQLLVFLALAAGRSSFTTNRISDHLMTNLWAIERFVKVQTRVGGDLGEAGRVEIESQERRNPDS